MGSSVQEGSGVQLGREGGGMLTRTSCSKYRLVNREAEWTRGYSRFMKR